MIAIQLSKRKRELILPWYLVFLVLNLLKTAEQPCNSMSVPNSMNDIVSGVYGDVVHIVCQDGYETLQHEKGFTAECLSDSHWNTSNKCVGMK